MTRAPNMSPANMSRLNMCRAESDGKAPPDGKALKAVFPAHVESLSKARKLLQNFIVETGWPGSRRDVIIVFGEVMQNIIRHGFNGGRAGGIIVLKAMIEGRLLRLFIEDNAPPSSPAGWNADNLEAHQGGFGLDIIRRASTEVEFTAIEGGNIVRLKFDPDQAFE